jgi:hypothetical protein
LKSTGPADRRSDRDDRTLRPQSSRGGTRTRNLLPLEGGALSIRPSEQLWEVMAGGHPERAWACKAHPLRDSSRSLRIRCLTPCEGGFLDGRAQGTMSSRSRCYCGCHHRATSDKTTPRGFQPLRAEASGFRVYLLSHSDAASRSELRETIGREFSPKESEA